MKALVVFESMFGNTETVAAAVAEGLSAVVPVELVEVGVAPAALADDVGLLVLGAPTHAFGLSRPRTREDAARQVDHPVVSQGAGLREWLDAFEPPARPVAVAVFDTRIDRPRVPGSAARAASRRLRRRELPHVGEPESFYVTGTEGPLLDGERRRARDWGERLGAALLAGAPRA